MSFFNAATIRANKPQRNVNIISGGNAWSVAIQRNGRVWAWGYNFFGQLGDNSITNRVTPVRVLGANKTFCVIDIGSSAQAVNAIDNNGLVWSWGNGGNGQLGNNTTASQLTPVSIGGARKTFCLISSGGSYCIAIDKNGRVWGWGYNGNGRIGDNSTTQRLTPVSVLGAVKTFCKISAGNFQTLAIDKNGRAWGWGINTNGQLGDNSTTQRLTPVSVLGAVKTFCIIATGASNTSAIDKNGRVWSWGLNSSGQLGDNSTTQRLTPVSVLGAVKTFCKISIGNSYVLAIDKNGRAWGWGSNGNGQIGNDTVITNYCTPVSVAGAAKTFCSIDACSNTALAIDKNGRAWAWGSNGGAPGEIGNNLLVSYITPIRVGGANKTFCKVFGANIHSLAVDKNGTVWTWGTNTSGQLGINSLSMRLTPVRVLGTVKTFCEIAGQTTAHSVAIDKNGRAWAWGGNANGQLGDNSTTSRLTPVSVLGAVKTFCVIAAATTNTIAIDRYGRAWGWGINANGQLGDNSTTQRLTPVSVLGAVKTFCKIAGTSNSTVAIDRNGRAWGWGRNGYGQLGDNSITQRLTPVSVLGSVKTFCHITGGSGNLSRSYTLAIDKNGRAWGWGYNGQGVLGNNSTISQRTPVSVLGAIKTFCKISAGSRHNLAIDKYGRLWAWGINGNGQLGDNSTTARCTPVSVLGAIKTFCEINAGIGSNSIAIDKNGVTWSWGSASNGVLGNGSTICYTTPVRVCNI